MTADHGMKRRLVLVVVKVTVTGVAGGGFIVATPQGARRDSNSRCHLFEPLHTVAARSLKNKGRGQRATAAPLAVFAQEQGSARRAVHVVGRWMGKPPFVTAHQGSSSR